MKHHALTVIALVAAACCYVAGSREGAQALIAAGFIFELVFWRRVLRGSKAS